MHLATSFLQLQHKNLIAFSLRLYRDFLYNSSMKLRYRYRIYPTYEQVKSLSKLFGCTRVVWNDALAFCQSTWKEGIKYPGSSELMKQFIMLLFRDEGFAPKNSTQAKADPSRCWLSEVSNIPLQQSIRDLDVAFRNFWNSLKGKQNGAKVKPPRFKQRRSKQSARFTVGGFSVKSQRYTGV